MDSVDYASRLRDVLRRRRARARARNLLLAHLTPAQRASLAEHGFFVVRGNCSGDEYEVHMRDGINVERVRDRTRFCFSPRGALLPRADVVLGQVLILRHREDWLLQKTGWR